MKSCGGEERSEFSNPENLFCPPPSPLTANEPSRDGWVGYRSSSVHSFQREQCWCVTQAMEGRLESSSPTRPEHGPSLGSLRTRADAAPRAPLAWCAGAAFMVRRGCCWQRIDPGVRGPSAARAAVTLTAQRGGQRRDCSRQAWSCCWQRIDLGVRGPSAVRVARPPRLPRGRP